MSVKLGDIAFITKLAGFEHTKYIQGNISHYRTEKYDTPLFIGKTIRDGHIDNNYDWFLPHSISDKLPRSQLNKKCLVMPYVGTLGDLAIFDPNERCHLGSNVAKIELNPDCNYSEEFIYYFIRSPWGQRLLFHDVQGGVQKNITMEAIRDIELPDITIAMQDKLVSILKAMDNKIANNNDICINLEAIARLLYEYWFLQFDFENNNDEPYKTSGGKMVYDDMMKREIPEGWKVVKVKDIISHINTGLNPRQNFVLNNGDIRYITVKNLTTKGTIDFTTCDTIDEEALEKVHKRSDISKGDILFASIAPLGRCVIIREDPNGWDINESVFSIRPKNKNLSEYLYMFFTSEAFIKKAEQSSTGSVFSGIRISVLEDMKIVVPPEDILDKFNQIVSPIFDLKYRNEMENQKLKEIRDFLLPLLMNGQIRIGN